MIAAAAAAAGVGPPTVTGTAGSNVGAIMRKGNGRGNDDSGQKYGWGGPEKEVRLSIENLERVRAQSLGGKSGITKSC